MIRKILAIIIPIGFLLFSAYWMIVAASHPWDDSNILLLPYLLGLPWNLFLFVIHIILSLLFHNITTGNYQDIVDSIIQSAAIVMNTLLLRRLILRIGSNHKQNIDPNKSSTI